MPVVRSGILLEPEPAGSSIALDTSAWFAWLAVPTTTHFSYALFNRRRGYIGPAAALMQARLDQIAARLHQVQEP